MFSRTITRTLSRAGQALAVVGTLAAGPALAQGQATPPVTTHFTAADLARACGPAADDANAMASRSACYATFVTVGQMHSIYGTGRNAPRPAFCMPNPSPSMNQVATSYVSWAAANPQHAGVRAAEGALRFAAATYPCPPPARRRR